MHTQNWLLLKKVPICFFAAFVRGIGPAQPKEYPMNQGFLFHGSIDRSWVGFSESCFPWLENTVQETGAAWDLGFKNA